ncbi:MAG: MFS transporter [Oscillospiraceae bacterium]|nr:MFS transporter [Oscillospiraceae bacterium]
MKLNYKRTFLVGLAFLSICTFWQAYDGIIPLILKNTFGIGEATTGQIMAIDNMLALVMLPLFGSISDKTKTPIGKRSPYIICGTIVAVISMLFLAHFDNKVNLLGFALCLGLTLLAMATYRSPAVSLMPDVTPKKLRSKGNAVINIMGTVGGVIALLLIKFLIPKEGKPNFFPIFAIIACVMIGAVVVLVLTIRENKLVKEMEETGGYESTEAELNEEHSKGRKMPKDVLKSLVFMLGCVAFFFFGYNAVTTFFSLYMTNFLNVKGGGFADYLLISTVFAVLFYLPSGWLATKFGRKKAVMLGLSIMAFCFLVMSFFKNAGLHLLPFFAIIGFGYACVIVNTFPIVWEMSQGSDIGKYTGYYYTASMAAQIVTPMLVGGLIEKLDNYGILFPYAVVMEIIAFLMLMQVKHGDSKPVPHKDKLEALDVGGDD